MKPVVIIQNIGPVDIVRIARVNTFAGSKRNTKAVSYGGKDEDFCSYGERCNNEQLPEATERSIPSRFL